MLIHSAKCICVHINRSAFTLAAEFRTAMVARTHFRHKTKTNYPNEKRKKKRKQSTRLALPTKMARIVDSLSFKQSTSHALFQHSRFRQCVSLLKLVFSISILYFHSMPFETSVRAMRAAFSHRRMRDRVRRCGEPFNMQRCVINGILHWVISCSSSCDASRPFTLRMRQNIKRWPFMHSTKSFEWRKFNLMWCQSDGNTKNHKNIKQLTGQTCAQHQPKLMNC